MMQNTLLAQYYTILHNYCEDNGFPSPPPPMDDVISVWSQDFQPIQQEVESINCIARGKAVHQPMSLGDDGTRQKSITGLNVRNGLAGRRASSQGMLTSGAASQNQQSRVLRIPSATSLPSTAVVEAPAPSPSPSPEPSTTPDYSTHLAPQTSYASYAPAGPRMDFFQNSTNTAIPRKKPPPPPPKRTASNNPGPVAIALYDFAGQGAGDLAFREGDRIKVVKKTDSTDDWWEGELRGVKGSFPANYCKLA